MVKNAFKSDADTDTNHNHNHNHNQSTECETSRDASRHNASSPQTSRGAGAPVYVDLFEPYLQTVADFKAQLGA